MGQILIRAKCGICGKVAKEINRTPLHRMHPAEEWERDDTDMETLNGHSPDREWSKVYKCWTDEIYGVIIHLECGHNMEREIERADETIEIISEDGRTPFDFQWETTQFIEAAGCEGLILHEQGLGKTICACMILKRNRKHVLPCLYVCKSGLIQQVFGEIVRWTGMIPQIISSSSDIPQLDWFKVTLVSIDMLRLIRPDVCTELDESVPMERLSPKDRLKRLKAKNPRWTDELIGKYKLIIMDESQKIKNTESSRTQVFRYFVKTGNGGKKAKCICMSGTNIEKHAGEYFVTLNAVRPELFSHKSEFLYKYVDVDEYGKPHGLKDPKRFKALTEDFIIRYRRSEVLPDLPPVFRQFKVAEMGVDEKGVLGKGKDSSKDLLEQYKKVVSEFQEFMLDEETRKTPTDILGYMARMRHITGIAKVPAALEFIEEFLLENDDDRKIVVFLHHKKAGAILMDKLCKLMKDAGYPEPLYLNAEQDMKARSHTVEMFKKPGQRVMLASTLAAGEGLNLQFCSDCLIMERQFNPSIEEQAEGRFPRPGRGADMPNIINAVYLSALGTIDDFLTHIVEEKRKNVKATLDYAAVNDWDESSLMKELTRELVSHGLTRWKL